MIKHKDDSKIIDLIVRILGNGTMAVETFNESILVKLLEERGTPIRIRKSFRNIDNDFKLWQEENNLI